MSRTPLSRAVVLAMLLCWCHPAWASPAADLSPSQSTSSSPLTTASAAASTSHPSPTVTPTPSSGPTTSSATSLGLSFAAIPTLTACGSERLDWVIANQPVNMTYSITFNVVNIGVDQDIPTATTSLITSVIPPATTTPASSRSASPAPPPSGTATASSSTVSPSTSPGKRSDYMINATIGAQYAGYGYTWAPISLPQGRYYLLASLDDQARTHAQSPVFTVVQSGNTSCIAALFNGSTSSTVTGTPTSASASTQSANSGAHGSQSGVGGSDIAGIVIGLLAILAALALIAFLCFRRRRRTTNRRIGAPQMQQRGTYYSAFGMTQPNTSRHQHLPSEATTPADWHGVTERGISPASAPGESTPLGFRARTSSMSSADGRDSPNQAESAESDDDPRDRPVILPSGTERRSDPDPFAIPSAPTPSIDTPIPSGMMDFLAPPLPALMADRAPVWQSRPQVQSTLSPSAPSSVASDLEGTGRQRFPSQKEVGRQAGTLGRSTSKKRKPVPSLGVELRKEMAKQENGSGSSGAGRPGWGRGGTAAGTQRRYTLQPDLPSMHG